METGLPKKPKELETTMNQQVIEIERDMPTSGLKMVSRGLVRNWRVGVLTCLILVMYFAVLRKLMRDWWYIPDFSHGLLVPFFSAYLIWKRKDRLKSLPSAPSWIGFPIILFALGILIAGSYGAELFLPRISLLFLLAGVIVTFRGWNQLRVLAFPLLVLILALPIPEIIFNQITIPLQLLASRLASDILPLFNVPVLRQGNVIYLPSMPLEVAEACSGIRSLMSLGTLAIFYGYFLENSITRRVILAFFSIPIAVAANAFRIVGTGLCVQYWDPAKALGFFHEFSGWVIFLVSLAILYGIHLVMRLFRKKEQPAA
jgi:exosortase